MAPDLRPSLVALMDRGRRGLLPFVHLSGRARQHVGAFRRSRAFLPVAIVVPALAIASIGGSYAAWDSTRVAVPSVVGQPLSEGIGVLRQAGLEISDVGTPESALDANCYLIAGQSSRPGDRVVPTDNPIALEVVPTRGPVPDVTGLTLEDAEQTLIASCLLPQPARLWCVPEGFSGGVDVLKSAALATDTGFTYDAFLTRLRHDSLDPDDTWIVCDQLAARPRDAAAGSPVGLVLTAPLTTVPSPSGTTLEATLVALGATADECALTAAIATTFPDDPGALRGVSSPPATEMSNWTVAALVPEPGSAVLCDDRIRVDVVWPRATMPQLVGLFHAPDSAQASTATTAAVEAAGLTAHCTGRGTVTSQTPAAGAAVPVGTSVTCVAELLMPNIVGMNPASAQATLTAAGVTGTSSGSGIVVSQSPAPGTLVTGSTYVTFTAQEPRPVYVASAGGSAYYQNCTAARAAGVTPIYRGEPGYRAALDRDNDGIACE